MFPCLPTQKGRWQHDTEAAPVQGFEDHQAQKWEQLSPPTLEDKKTIQESGVQMVTRDLVPYRITGGAGFRQFVQSVSCDIIILLWPLKPVLLPVLY